VRVGVIIGRFQPFHNGHLALVQSAFDEVDELVIVVGSTGAAPDMRNPWSFDEVETMIRGALPFGDTRVRIEQNLDVPYDDHQWLSNLRGLVENVKRTDPIKLYGCDKDPSTFYLAMIQRELGWQFHNVGYQHSSVKDATEVRFCLFGSVTPDFERLQNMVPWSVFEKVSRIPVDRWSRLHREARAVIDHKDFWGSHGSDKYGSQHVAVDALVTAGNGVVLIKRKGAVGNGSWALPGGFVEKGERLVDAALRELREEAGIHVQNNQFPKVGATVAFDYPWREMRGRMFTNVLHVELDRRIALSPGDDAAEAQWFTYSRAGLEIIRADLFSDHYHILNHFLPKVTSE
jgi:bifunctional NMN adenylyltransferase/nudix hydrolase